jgi:DNA-binding winged helix-turn-helix (wHTH) protein
MDVRWAIDGISLVPDSADVLVLGPGGDKPVELELPGDRVTVGRLPEVNDISLQPDPQLLVTRAAHFTLERAGTRWFVVDGGSVNGTFLRRKSGLERIVERTALHDGDVICVLASIAETGQRTYFELAFHATEDSEATRAAVGAARSPAECLTYDANEARLLLVRDAERHEIPIRAQAHRLVRYMAERNVAAGGAPALCTHDELMHAVWADEPMHSREELAKLVWELRKKLEPFQAEHLIENARRLGYRMRTCPSPRD